MAKHISEGAVVSALFYRSHGSEDRVLKMVKKASENKAVHVYLFGAVILSGAGVVSGACCVHRQGGATPQTNVGAGDPPTSVTSAALGGRTRCTSEPAVAHGALRNGLMLLLESTCAVVGASQEGGEWLIYACRGS